MKIKISFKVQNFTKKILNRPISDKGGKFKTQNRAFFQLMELSQIK